MRAISMRIFFVCILLFLLSSPLVRAQTVPNPPKAPQLTTQFNFSPPGARSLGMGAAFIALADDATASESNPAGLVILGKPEVSAHFRFSSFYNEFPDTVNLQGSDTFKDVTASASFLSFVYPRGRTAFSVYYEQPGNFKSHSQFCCDFAGSELEDFQNTESSDSTFKLENIGGAGAVRLGSATSLGASIRQTRLNLQYGTFSIFTTCIPIPDTDPPLCPVDQSIRVEKTIDDSGSKVTFNAGILVTLPRRLSLGFVYKKGAEFDAKTTDVFDEETNDASFSETTTTLQPFKIPDSFGGGVAYRPKERWVLLADVVHITYSDISTTTVDEDTGETQIVRANSAMEFHAGTEYIRFYKDTPISFRVGLFTDPDHDLFPEIDSGTIHFTFGGGIVILHGTLQIDAAVNLSGNTKEGLFSFVQRF